MASDDFLIMSNADVAEEYGQHHRNEYGGSFVEAGLLIVLFTDHLEEHRARLMERLPHPHLARIRSARRTFDAVERDRAAVRAILSRHQEIPVVSTSIGRDQGEFVVEVGLLPFSPSLATQAATLVEPRPVVVREGRMPRRT